MAYQPKSYRKFLAGSVSAALVASAVGPVVANAASFSDVNPNDSHAANINALVELGYIKGFADGTFKPYQSITRGQVAKIFARILEDKGFKAPEKLEQVFDDVPLDAKDQELVKAAAIVKAAGVMTGTDGKLNPGQPITRQQMAKVLVEAFDLTKSDDFTSKITDLDKADAWARDYIQTLEANGVTVVTEFKPKDNVTRAAFASFVKRALDATAVKEVTADDITAVKFVDENTLEVTFNGELKDVKKEDFSIEGVEIDSVSIKAAAAAESKTTVVVIKTKTKLEEGKTYTVAYKGKTTDKTKVEVPVVTPKVESVSAINGTKLEVKFNKAIDKNTIQISDFIINPLDGQTLTVANLVGTLSADGKTYTIETSNGEYFNKRYDVTLKNNVVKTQDGKDVPEYKTTIDVKDTVAPTIKEVTYEQAGSGKVDVTVKFDEQLSSVGTVSVDGVAVNPTFTQYTNEMKIAGLDAGKTYKIDVVGATDVAGNIANPLSASIATSTDSSLPTVVVTVTNTTIKLDFSEKVQNTFVVKVNNGNALAATQDANDPTVYTVDASSELGTSTFLNNAKITVTNIYDLAGNKGQDVEVTANLVKDTTAPKFVSATTDGAKLVLKYDEKIEFVPSQTIDQSDLTIKFQDKDGILHNLTPTTDYTASSVIGYDLNGNTTIDAGTEEEKYVVITLTEAGSKDFITTDGKLAQGTYTVTVAKDQLQDATGNKVAASTFTVVVGAGTGTPAKTVTYSADNTGLPNNQFKVTFSEDMSNSVLDASKYTLGGVALPTGTTLTFVDDKRNVLVTLPEGYITVNGPRVLTVSGVTAADGDLLDTDNQPKVTLNLKENVAPVASKVTVVSDSKAVVDFSEPVSGAATGIKVKVNGVEVSSASLNVVNGDLEVNFAAGTLKATDKVTVEFSDADLVDAAGNKVKDGSISN
jgi:trimeric autotransporter adhesin